MKKSKSASFLMGNGEVCVEIISIVGLGTYSLQKLKKPGKVGRSVKASDIKETSPLVTMYFTSEEGVTREIIRLQRLRRMMRRTGAAPLKDDAAPKCGAI